MYYSKCFVPNYIQKLEGLDSQLIYNVPHCLENDSENDFLMILELIRFETPASPSLFSANQEEGRNSPEDETPRKFFILRTNRFYFHFNSNFHEVVPVKFKDFYSCFFEVSIHGIFSVCNIFDLYKIGGSSPPL